MSGVVVLYMVKGDGCGTQFKQVCHSVKFSTLGPVLVGKPSACLLIGGQ